MAKLEIYQLKSRDIESLVRELNLHLFDISKRLANLADDLDQLTDRVETLESA